MMPFLTATGTDARRKFRWREWLMLLCILSLTTSLATRYVHISPTETFTTVKAGSSDSQRQRLHKNAFQWTAPVDEFTAFVSLISPHRPEPPQPPLVVHLDESLYNRPPPSC
jgi:hypothetical protein